MAFSLRMHLFHWKRHVYSSISSWRVLNLQGRYVPNLTWKVVPICDHAELSRRMTLLWCTSGMMCWFIFSVFPYWMQAPMVFCGRMLKLETQSFLVSKSWYWSIPINSPTVATIPTPTCSESNRKICRPRHMDFTSRRCCHRESLALQILHPQKTDGWNWTLQLHMMMWWNLPFPARSCSFLMSVVPPLQIGQMQEKVSIKAQIQEISGEQLRRIQNMEYTFIRRYKWQISIPHNSSLQKWKIATVGDQPITTNHHLHQQTNSKYFWQISDNLPIITGIHPPNVWHGRWTWWLPSWKNLFFEGSPFRIHVTSHIAPSKYQVKL